MTPEDSRFGRFLVKCLPTSLHDLYSRYAKQVNYLFVCGFMGVVLNYVVYHGLAYLVWEPVAFAAGIAVGFVNNYTFTVGPLGHLFGLSEVKHIVE